MLDSFIKFINHKNLLKPNDNVLLGISGGIDSMVMLHLFGLAGFNFSIAHCNFKLRGKESDRDQDFIEGYAKNNNIKIFTRQFPAKEYATDHKISIQMAARELRINWFKELILKYNFSSYATAHHLDDQAETFFINLLRGTGIAGLHGILPIQGKLIHPLLFTDRNSIVKYAKEEKIKYREDSSNKEIKYHRNKIRHQVIPLLNDIKPGFSTILAKNIERFRAAEALYKKEINRVISKILTKHKDNTYTINISKLQDQPDVTVYLFEIISGFGFNYPDAEDMIRAITSEPGKVFYSSTHRIIRDREFFIIEKKKDLKSEIVEYSINLDDKKIKEPVNINIEVIEAEPDFKIDPVNNTGYFDLQTLAFPLKIRKWKKGDFFYPLGLNHKKLLSDYFIDNKFSIRDKENTWLLISGTNIVWIIGHRIDDRFKIKTKSQLIYKVIVNPYS